MKPFNLSFSPLRKTSKARTFVIFVLSVVTETDKNTNYFEEELCTTTM